MRYDDKSWKQHYEVACSFFENNGHLRVPARYVTEDGVALGKWISNLRTKYRNNKEALDEEQIRQLNEIGMVWDDNEALWQHHYGLAATFYDENGHLNVPVDYTSQDGFNLGRWLTQLRTARRNIGKRKLTEEQICLLDEIGMVWDKRNDLIWKQGYKFAEEYYLQYGNIDVPNTYKTDEGFALGKWIARQQYAYNNPKKINSILTEERIELLKKIGIFFK